MIRNTLLLLFIVLFPFFVSAQVYTPTGQLNAARWRHQSQLLYNQKVLVFGGDDGYLSANVFTSAELYNPATGDWSYTGSMKKKRTDFSSAVLPNGNVLAIGGTMSWDGNDLYNTTSCEIYNVNTDTWLYTDSIQAERYGHKAILLKTGKVLVVGGNNNKTCELYDPTSNKWSYTGNNVNSMIEGMDLVMLQDGKILATFEQIAELYDPQTGTWSLVNNTLNGNRT
ncbi:MAG TPA: hypothetical protein VNW06_00280, partial [Cytophagaceae bacterium]|nr:hypothetical protein [Cytophagaceae bacterium]